MSIRVNSVLVNSLLAGMIVLLLSACDIEKTEEGELPDVDVEAESGQLPEYEVTQTQEGEMPDVDVDMQEGELPEYDVETADVEVETKTKEVEVPTDIDVEMPDEQKSQE